MPRDRSLASFRFGAIAAAAMALFASTHGRKLPVTLDVLSYNDVYEMGQDTVGTVHLGGPSRVVPIATAMRKANANSLVLFAGDTVSPSLWSTQFNGQHMVQAHNALGLDFAALGNHEFDFGLENFVNVTRASKFSWLNANCYERATGALLRGTVPYAIKRLAGAKSGALVVGVFGVMYDMQDTSKGLYWEDPIEAARKQVKALQALGVDVVIALTHQGFAADNRFAAEVQGVDLIVGGHDHTSMLETKFGTPYVKADFDFRSIWKTHIEYEAARAGAGRKTVITHERIPIVESLPTDKALDQVIASYRAQMEALEKRVIGSVCEDLDLTQKVVRARDSTIGFLFADAGRQFYGNGSADVAVMNGGGIRGDKIVPAGNLSLGEVLSWSPFGNTLMTVQTNGASLKQFLTREMGTSCGAGRAIQENGFYVHPSGFQYTFTCTGEGVGTVSSLTWLNHPTKRGVIQDSDALVMAISNFLYTSEFIVLQGVQATVRISEAEAERMDSALETYVTKWSNGNVCLRLSEQRSSVSF